MEATRKPRVLLLYYTYTGQTLKVLETAGEVLRERGCEVTKAAIEYTDKRWADGFTRFPMRNAWTGCLRMLPAQLRRKTGEIRIPDEARSGDYDLICIGSGTWWLTTNMPMRSFLKSSEAEQLLAGKPFAAFVVCRRYWKNNLATVRKLGTERGGSYVDGIHFNYPGGQTSSLLSLISYLGSGEYRDRYLGLRIPKTNLQPEQIEETRTFAQTLADRVFGPAEPRAGDELSGSEAVGSS
jgi:menaquinone-dependent protoporphyrinogen IX oxidase